ncbi:hypothetical protein M9Y10_007875 [Tritrichomonas musculus]|uniref:Uncharacterized protein n=1 Tax=Tritrichomonas musculus TaxID=1915356 RepID=A0ABR2J2K4_9EUKA
MSKKLVKEHFLISKIFDKLKFQKNSQLEKIEKFAFFKISIESIEIPSQVKELGEGLFRVASKLNKVRVSPENQIFCSLEDKIIFKKTKVEQDNYDCLIYGVNNIKSVIVPSSIEHICNYAFDGCEKLKKIEIQNDSKLKTINKESFSFTSIDKIRIPSQVELIGYGAFSFCTTLKQVDFEDDSKLKTIGYEAFAATRITSIIIPSHVEHIYNRAFNICKELQIIEFSENSEFKSISPFSFIKKVILFA